MCRPVGQWLRFAGQIRPSHCTKMSENSSGKGPPESFLDPQKVMPAGITLMTAIFVALLLVTLKAPSQEGQINAQNRATLRSLNAPGSPAFFPSAPLSGNLTRPMAGRPAWIPILGRPSGGGTSTLVPGVPGGAPAHNCDIQDTLDDGFRWLANEQLADGSWPEDTGDKGVAVTGLAMLAFYMNDYTHVGGLYQLHMEKALNYMIHASQANNGDVWHILPGAYPAGAYVQAIATYALAEAYRRTGDPKIRQPTVDCLRVLLAGCNNQTYMGKQKYSWRYNTRCHQTFGLASKPGNNTYRHQLDPKNRLFTSLLL